MPSSNMSIDSVHLPRFLYGTAWKEEDTQSLTELALQQGFRGFDTANQRRHYHEAAVGRAVTGAIESGLVERKELFVQTKFTFQRGQDNRLPYDPKASIPIQVEQSFASSLRHLEVESIDSYLLHGPSTSVGLTKDDWAAWRAMEAIHDRGRARLIGISNFTVQQLEDLCRESRVRPRFVQNRCYANRGWDRRVREFCSANAIIYQGFSLLTANRELVARPEIARIAQHHGRTVSQIVFRFALEVGIIPLTGTSDANHMQGDLDIFNFHLEPEDVEQIEMLAMSSRL